MDGRVERPSECVSERVKRPKFLLTTEQFNHHFSQDQFVIKLRGNQLNICFETRPHGLELIGSFRIGPPVVQRSQARRR